MKIKYVNKDRNGNDLHAYYIDKPRAKNISNVAKMGLDEFNLSVWLQNQIMLGMVIKPALLERVALNIDNRDALIKIAEEARNEAGAHEGRDRGNVLHQALEAHDLGERILPTDLTSTAIKSWEHILEAMQWEVTHVERVVAWPEERIAGRFDRIVKGPMCMTCGGTHYIVDYKSGEKVLEYPHQIVVQLTLYGHAPVLAGPIPAEGGETEDVGPMPPMCKCKGYTVHLPSDRDARLIEMPLRMDIVDTVIRPIIRWRAESAKSLAKIVDIDAPKPVVEETDPFAGLPGVELPPPLERPSLTIPEGYIGRIDDLAIKHANLRDRLQWLKENHPDMARVVASRWPEGVPNIRMPLTADDLDRIEVLLVQAEREVEAPFNPIQGATDVGPRHIAVDSDPVALPDPVLPAAQDVDEGPLTDETDLAAFKGAFGALEGDLQARIDSWAREAQEAGVSFSLRALPSMRRFTIGRFCLLACHHHDDVVRAVLALVLGDEIQTVVTTGFVLGVLTREEAEKAWSVLLSLETGSLVYDAGKLVAA